MTEHGAVPEPDVTLEHSNAAVFSATRELGVMLKSISDRDPAGTPSEAAADAFVSWLNEAAPVSKKPIYFHDVATNYDIAMNSNKDLFELFEVLGTHMIEFDDDEDLPAPDVRGTYIGLPMAGSSDSPFTK